MKNKTIRRIHRGIAIMMSACMAAGIISTSPVGKTAVANAAEVAQIEVQQGTMSVMSPNEIANANFWLDEQGACFYNVHYKGTEVVEKSALGFLLKQGETETEYRDGFQLVGIQEEEQVDESWENPFGDRKTVPDCYRETKMQLQTRDGLRVDVICRAYDEGVAFCYSFPQDPDAETFQIMQELTFFNLDDEATAYVHKNRNQTEVVKIPVTELKKEEAGYFRPLTVIGDNYAMTITEANQVDYTRVHFTAEDGSEPGTLRTVFNGYSDNVDLMEEHIEDAVTVDISEQSFETSWRTFVLGDQEGDLVENHYLVQNLNPPCVLSDISWITPGKSLRSSLTTAKAKMAIDFAVKHNIEYVHFDAGWYGPEGKMESDPWKCIDAFDLDEISAYADQYGIKLMVYINYRHLENEYRNGRLDDLFKMYVSRWGIDGIKFGFVPVGSQASTKMVYEWVKIAADNKLIVDIHDEMLTTGYDRTYPNLLTYEAIHGDEENPTPKDDLGYLFTRMVAGQADHTWCFNRNDRNTTKAFRIAGSIVYYSPMIFPYWYDDGALGSINHPATGMWDDMPTTWDESHMLEASIEEYATVARRSGTRWYLAAISAVDHELSLPLTMLDENKKYKAEIYINSQSDINQVTILTYLVDSADTLRYAMQSNSGCSVRITEASEEEASMLIRYREEAETALAVAQSIAMLPEVTASNLIETEKQVKEIRKQFQELTEGQKLGVYNVKKLIEAENKISRLLTSPAKMLYVNGKELEGFDAGQTEYSLTLLGGAQVPYVTCDVYSESRITSISQPDGIPGTASITVKNAFVEKTYRIHFTVPSEAAVIYASDYKDYTLDGRKEFKVDTDRSGGVLTLYNENGEKETFEKGIGTHAATNIYFNTKGMGISRFQAICGVSANNGKDTNKVGFKVYKNSRSTDNLLFDSGAMTQKTPYQVIDVDVTGAEQIILEANDGGDGISNDHANWCDAKFILGEVFTTPIDEMIAKAENLKEQIQDETAKVRLTEAVDAAILAKTPEEDELTYQMVYDAAVDLRDVILEVKAEQAGDVSTLIKEALGKDESSYTEESYTNMVKALTNVQMLSQDVDAELSKLTEAAEYLKQAMEALEVKEDGRDMVRTELNRMIAQMESLNADDYTAESWAKAETALSAAKAVSAKEEASQSSLDMALADLIKAFGELEYTVQKLHLETAVNAAERILVLAVNYEEDAAALAAATEAGKEILADRAASQETVDNAAYAVLDELAKLAKKADVSSLESLLEAAKELEKGKYTEESRKNLTDAIAEAEKVLQNPERGEQDICDAYAALIDAIIGLERKGNKAALAAVIAKAELILADSDAYVFASLDGMEEILEDAKVVYDNDNAVQAEIDEAVKALTLKVAEVRLIGDVNGDGVISTGDSAVLLSYAAEYSDLTEEEAESADVNRDGAADTMDAVLILKYTAEQITAF